ARIGAVTKKLWSKNHEGQNGNLAKKSDFIPPLSLLPSLSLSSLSLLRAIWVVQPFAFQGTARPLQAERISAVGTYGSAFVSSSQPDRSQPRGLPELAGKPSFPTEVPAKPPELPARNSPSFLHQIDRASEVQPISVRKLQRAVEGRGIHHRANHSFRAKVKSFGIGQNTGETLPNFRQKSKGKKDICARHSPGVGHAQDLARISK
ncbi:aldose 1-epimerase family protein, partial [Prunus dulcis]